MKQGDKVRIKPTTGCCNSTLCFWEWEIMEITRAQFSVFYEDVALLRHNDQIEIVAVSKLVAL